MQFLEHGGEKWNIEFFKTHTLHECRRILCHKRADQVINIWKQLNGKSVRSKKKKVV